jgi:nitroreductase
MNETLTVIKTRRSVRQYEAKQITDSEIQQILDAAIYAPNARNQQMWHFTVIQNTALIDQMVDIIKENLMNSGIEFHIGRASAPGYHTFYHAPTVVLVTGDEKAQFVQFDCGAAAQTIALAAKSLGVASCVMTSSGFLFQSEKGNALKKEFGIPDGYNHVCAVALGYQDGKDPEVPPRKKEVINYVR